ncbi:MAG TPA: ectoine synthase [Gammaproteobacteria bacterium]|nr:ectoine synthase [Gammaproteobacteria bacterium]
MIVRKLKDLIGTDKEVGGKELGWTSRRLLLKGDGMGYSVHDTVIHEGAECTFHYANHLEAVYLIEGKGEITDLGTGETHQLEAGTIYALDKHDRHILRANKGTHMRMVCVFNPPVTGNEVHDETGAYPLVDDTAA